MFRHSRLRPVAAMTSMVLLAVSLVSVTVPSSVQASHFTDISSSPFQTEINWLEESGITGGCTATQFCPKARVTREQMAAFLVRALGLTARATDPFDDDDGRPFEPDIEKLAESGITGGCAARRFCPTAHVTREQMAAFLVRALDLTVREDNPFDDDDGRTFEPDIEKLAESGITGGCATRRFCPTAHVTREQMAAFLYRAFADDVTPTPTPPNAVNDSATIAQGCAWQYTVLQNDTVPSGDGPLNIIAVTQPSHGDAAIVPHLVGGVQAPRGVAYSADSGYAGADSFTYTVQDADGETDTATVSVTVIASTGDTDTDGRPNECDAFSINPSSATASLNFDGAAGGDWQAAGFTGVMTNSRHAPATLIDADAQLTGTGRWADPDVDEGDAFNGGNDQRNAFHVGFDQPAGNFEIHGAVCAPYPTAEFSSVGVYFGLGDQNNYVKAVVDTMGVTPAVHDTREVNGEGFIVAAKSDTNISAASCVHLYLTVNRSTKLYVPAYSLDGGTTRIGFGGTASARLVPDSWLAAPELAAGVIATAQGPAADFAAAWDFLEVTAAP